MPPCMRWLWQNTWGCTVHIYNYIHIYLKTCLRTLLNKKLTTKILQDIKLVWLILYYTYESLEFQQHNNKVMNKLIEVNNKKKTHLTIIRLISSFKEGGQDKTDLILCEKTLRKRSLVLSLCVFLILFYDIPGNYGNILALCPSLPQGMLGK